MELKDYLSPIRKWWWLLLAAALVAGISSFLVVMNQPPIYVANTTLLVGRAITDPNPSSQQFSLDSQLARVYADIANRETIYNATQNALGLDRLPDYEANAVPDSQLLTISVTDTSPQRAQVVANELANQLIRHSPTNPSDTDLARQDFINQQLDNLQEDIEETKGEIDTEQAQLGGLNSAREISEAQNRIDALTTKLASLQSTYSTLLLNSQQGATNTLTVMEAATQPVRPVGPNKPLIVILASLSGVVLAAGAAYLLEYISNTLNSREDIERALPYPIIGSIPDIKGENTGTYAAEFPFSPVAEGFRSLRTNLEFSGVDTPLKTIMVTSPGISEGKSTVAANLAFSMAQADKQVILMGADLREPTLHQQLGMANTKGLSDVFRGQIQLEDALLATSDSRVRVLLAGNVPPNPTELLGSALMKQTLARLSSMVDVVIIDSPPFIVADAAVLASRVDGLLLVVRPEYTRKELVEGMRKQILRINPKIFGVVLNRVSAGVDIYTSYYGHYGAKSDKNGKGSKGQEKEAGVPASRLVSSKVKGSKGK